MVHAGGSSLGGDFCQFFFSNDFISVLLGLMYFSDIVILCGSQIVVANKTLYVLICLIIFRFVFMKE